MTAGHETDLLRAPTAGAKVIRGGLVRAAGYAAAVALGAATSVFLLRYLGVEDFGRYATVGALLGIVSGLTDAGLIAVGNRELAVRGGDERQRLLRNLVALRLLIIPIGIAAATAFALAADYGRTLVLGVLVGGLGVLLVNVQATAMLPLAVDLRQGTMTAFEVARHALTLLGVAALVGVGASLLPFFAVQVFVGLAVVAATPFVLGRRALALGLDRESARMLIREALPLAGAIALNVVYFRVLVVLMSLLATEEETGYFGTSFRIFELLFGLPLLVLGVALPVVSVAAEEDEERLRFALQRLTEVALAAAVPIVLVLAILAEPALVLLGGEEYRPAAPVLQLQAVALLAVFLGQAWQLGLLAARRQSALVATNAAGLVLVVALGLALIPRFDARGAAVAAVIAEAVLAVLVFAFLRRARPAATPSLAFAWRVGVAAAAAAAPLLLGLPPLAAAAAALVLYLAVGAAARAFPRELRDALLPGR